MHPWRSTTKKYKMHWRLLGICKNWGRAIKSYVCVYVIWVRIKMWGASKLNMFLYWVGRFFNVFYPSDSCHDVKDLTRCFCGKDAFETSMRVRACQSLRSFHLTCDSGESRVTRIRAICKYMSHSKGSMYPMPCHVDSGHAKTVRLRPPCAVCWRLMLIWKNIL